MCNADRGVSTFVPSWGILACAGSEGKRPYPVPNSIQLCEILSSVLDSISKNIHLGESPVGLAKRPLHTSDSHQ